MGKMGLGLVAGAAGTMALDISTYLDMLVRGRPASEVPAKTAEALMDAVGVSLGRGDQAASRTSALGALFGYGTGIGLGVTYAVLRPSMEKLPMPISALLVGAGAMAISDGVAIATGATDPAEWGIVGWASDAFFHVIYGYVVVAVYEALTDD